MGRGMSKDMDSLKEEVIKAVCGGLSVNVAKSLLKDHKVKNKMDKQTVEIEAGYSFDRATEVIMDLILDGFSVEAESKDNQWHISAEKPNEQITIKPEDLEVVRRKFRENHQR